jgi:GntR family transcriptional regulator / MocR family aminotransferase
VAEYDSPLRPRVTIAALTPPRPLDTSEREFDFRAGQPDVSRFPFATWRALPADELRPTSRLGIHIDPYGLPELRAAITRHVGVARSVRTTPENVVVTNGSQQAMDIVARVLLDPGDVAVVEDPGYLPTRRAIQATGARVVPVPVDDDGLVVDALPAAAKLVAVTPSHQFPIGAVMSLRRRRALMDWARRTGAAIVEDDYDSEFRYGGRPLEPLHDLDRTGQVIYIGSFSKVLLPTLRLGFVVAPAPLVTALRTVKLLTDWHTEVPLQAATARFVQDGRFARHVRRMQTIYTQRRQVLLPGIAEHLGRYVTLRPSAAGLHVAVEFRDRSVDDSALAAQARDLGIALIPTTYMYADPATARPGLVLGYGAIETPKIDEGLRLLASLMS